MRILNLFLALFALALPLKAQELATLVADRIAVSGDNQLIAEGQVTIAFQGQTLRASAVRYDRTTNQLKLSGPIFLSDAKGNFVLASSAELSSDLSNGVMQSARMVLDQKLQIAAAQIFRAGGRYTQLSNTVASSCQVCSIAPTPLWEIRARRIVHDQQEQQLYFDNAQLRMAGVPVFYIPRLRIPDPTLDRATGFLMPRLRATSALGTGLKVPYFIRLGDSRDLTLTPYLSTKGGRTVEARYRQAFRTGTVQIDGAFSRDSLLPGERRGYLLAKGSFALPSDFKLGFSLETVSDPAYLLDYGLSQKDRLDSRIEVARTRRNEHISGRLVNFQSIRDGEANASLASLVGDLTFHRRFSGGPLGGEGGLRFQAHSHYRTSSNMLDSLGDADSDADGRDVARASVRLNWRRNWVIGPGILAATLAEATADIYHIQQDAVYAGNRSRMDAVGAVELRWPWVGTDQSGTSHVLEPVVQLVVSPHDTIKLPNEDSALVEFDEGNLYALNRFSGSDAREQGSRANIGLSYARMAASGWTLGVTMGRVIRTDNQNQFSLASGLDGMRSDWLAATRIGLDNGFSMTNRLLFDDNFDITKAEMRLDLNREKYGLASSYVWMLADPDENRAKDTAELYLDGRYAFTQNWSGKATGRFDLIDERATNAGLGLEFRNECLRLDLSLSRRFTSSTSVKPTTNFDLSVDLLGYGGGSKPGPARACRG